MESLDIDLCHLFYKVLNNHLTNSLSPESVKFIKRYLPEIRKKFKGHKVKETLVHSYPDQQRVSKLENSAYFYECSMCLASSTAKVFLDLSENNFNFFYRKMARKTINICIIAGVLASEIVAIVKVLCSRFEEVEQDYVHFRVSFVNANDKWNSVTSAVLKELKEYANESMRVKITSSFVVYEAKKLSHEVLEVFQSSDVLVATKFSQELCKIKDKEFKHLLQMAFQHMKGDSLFFFTDFSTASFIKTLEKELTNISPFQSIYKKLCVCHTLSLDSIESHLKCYGEHFGKDLNSSYCLLSATAWLKCGKKVTKRDAKFSSMQNIPQNKLKKCKRAARSSYCSYSKSVENICEKMKA